MAASYAGPPARLELYEGVVATLEAEARKGATMPYTLRNGHSSASSTPGLDGASPLRRRPRRFPGEVPQSLAEQHGRVMQEFVVVPDDLLDRTDELAGWFARSYEWIGALKPKPTKRSR